MGTAGQLIKGSIFRNIQLFVLLGVTFWITPVIVHSLGDRMYGFWTLIGTFIGYYGLLDFGLSSAAARFLSQSLGKGDTAELNKVANTACFLFSVIGAAVLLLTLAAALACSLFIRDPAEIVLFRRIVLLLGAAMAIGFPIRVYAGILTSYLRYDVIAYISIAKTLLTNAAIYLYLGRGGGIMGVALISFTVSLLQNAVTYAVCSAQFPLIKIDIFQFEVAKIGTMFSYSWTTFVCQIGDLLRFNIDSLIIAGFLNISLVTVYFVGIRFVDGFARLVMSSVGMMQPVFSQYEGRGDYDSIRSALLKVTKLSALLSAFIGLSIIFYAKALIFRWMGPGYEASYYVAAICSAAFMIELPQNPGIQLLFGLSEHKYYAVLNGCEAVLNVFFSLIFLKYYGMYGVVLGTAAEIVVIKLFVLPVYICRTIRLPVRVYLFDTMLVTLFKSAVPLGIYFYLTKGLIRPEYTRLISCVAGQAAFFAPTAYYFIITDAERKFIRKQMAFLFERTEAPGSERPHAAGAAEGTSWSPL